MAKTINGSWLRAHGVEAPKEELTKLAKTVHMEWELRVGTCLAKHLTPRQIDEITNNDDPDESVALLDEAYPDYPKIVDEKLDEIEQELAAAKNKIALIRRWDR